MAEIGELKRTVKVCMFDQYGTVGGHAVGLRGVAAPYLKSKGWTGNPNSLVTWWRRTHFENSMIDALDGSANGSSRPWASMGRRSPPH